MHGSADGATLVGVSSDGGQAAREALARAVETADEAVKQAPDGHAGFRLATELAKAFHLAGEQVSRFRGGAAKRIRDDEKLSLRALADEPDIDVSKSRLQQLLQEAADE
jgi:hypothetical protein